MKILSVQQIRKLDEFTIENEPIASIDLMERAARAFFTWFLEQFDSKNKILICCGTGNNGGDGLAVARLLIDQNYKVSVLVIGDVTTASKDFKTNFERLPIDVITYTEGQTLPDSDVIIDAVFGSGLSRPAERNYANLILSMNLSRSTIVSIDIPSGLFADRFTESENIIKAKYTISFQLPKLVFMLPYASQYVGIWHVVDIGLSQYFINEQKTPYHFTTISEASKLIKRVSKFDHKGTNGHALLVAGGRGKMGAAILASKACLRAGVGLLSVQVPSGGNDILQTMVPEAMTLADKHPDFITECKDVSPHSAIGIGPGLGKDKLTLQALEKFLMVKDKPLVLDADALNLLSENRHLIQIIPANSILTPHPKEFERFIGQEWKHDFERLVLQKEWAQKIGCIIILKGAHTSVALPDGNIYFNSTGNEGMAKGGSGDVLTGIITSLLAQKYHPHHAAILGVFLHGLAGDIAAQQKGKISMIASDIIDSIPNAYSQILSNC